MTLFIFCFWLRLEMLAKTFVRAKKTNVLQKQGCHLHMIYKPKVFLLQQLKSVHLLKPLTMHSDCSCSILLFTHSIPSCTCVISGSLSLYINKAVRLSLIQHCWVAIFCPSDVWCWVTSCITVKSSVVSFQDSFTSSTGVDG